MKIHGLLSIVLLTFLMPAHAFDYGNTPTGTANPPETMEQDQSVPTTPNIYNSATPLSKQPPPGTVVTPGATENNKPNYMPVYPGVQ